MQLNSEGLSTRSPQEFCRALKAARERNGVSLAAIADSTKIPASLFAELERSDLRHWPKGLFRRSFFRGYAQLIGVCEAEACAEFVLLFPDCEGAELIKVVEAARDREQVDVRLALDAAWRGPRGGVGQRLLGALADIGLVMLLAAAIAQAAGIDWLATTAVVALTYFSIASAVLGDSPVHWLLSLPLRVRFKMPHLHLTKDTAAAALQQSAAAIGSRGLFSRRHLEDRHAAAGHSGDVPR